MFTIRKASPNEMCYVFVQYCSTRQNFRTGPFFAMHMHVPAIFPRTPCCSLICVHQSFLDLWPFFCDSRTYSLLLKCRFCAQNTEIQFSFCFVWAKCMSLVHVTINNCDKTFLKNTITILKGANTLIRRHSDVNVTSLLV